MDDADITAYFIKHLSEEDDPDDLIMDICEKTGRSWPEVEALLNTVQRQGSREIAKRQFPLLISLAFIIFTSGMALTIYAVYTIVVAFQTSMDALLAMPDLDRAIIMSFYEGGMNPLYEFFHSVLIMVNSLATNPFFVLLLGVSMMLGSLLGMRDTWSTLLYREQ